MQNFVPKSLPRLPMPQKNAPKVTPKSIISSTFRRAPLARRTLPGLPIRILAPVARRAAGSSLTLGTDDQKKRDQSDPVHSY